MSSGLTSPLTSTTVNKPEKKRKRKTPAKKTAIITVDVPKTLSTQKPAIPAKKQSRNRVKNNGIGKYKGTVGVIEKFVEGFLLYAPMVMPRPVTVPTACYVSQRAFSIESGETEGAMKLSFIATPDLYSSLMWRRETTMDALWNAHTLTIVKHGALNLINDSLNVSGMSISTIPVIHPNANSVFIYPRIKSVNDYICAYPDFRDLDEYRTGIGAAAYYNTSVGQHTLAAKLIVKGTCLFNPIVYVDFYSGRDLVGNLQSENIPHDATSGGGSWSYTINKTSNASSSLTVRITDVSTLNGIYWEPLQNGNSNISYRDTDANVISDVESNDLALWRATVNSSESWAATGTALTLTNTAASIMTGGSATIALMPANYPMLSQIGDIQKTTNSRRYFKYSGTVALGCHGIWAPKDVSELMYHNPSSKLNTQFIIGSMSYAGLPGVTSMMVTLSTRKELQTNTTVIPTVMPLHSVNALSNLFAGLGMNLNLLYGCNATHMERTKKAVKDVANSQPMKEFAKSFGKELALSLLALPLAFI